MLIEIDRSVKIEDVFYMLKNDVPPFADLVERNLLIPRGLGDRLARSIYLLVISDDVN